MTEAFLFAIPWNQPGEAIIGQAVRHVAEKYGVEGAVRFVGARDFGRLFAIDHEVKR